MRSAILSVAGVILALWLGYEVIFGGSGSEGDGGAPGRVAAEVREIPLTQLESPSKVPGSSVGNEPSESMVGGAAAASGPGARPPTGLETRATSSGLAASGRGTGGAPANDMASGDLGSGAPERSRENGTDPASPGSPEPVLSERQVLILADCEKFVGAGRVSDALLVLSRLARQTVPGPARCHIRARLDAYVAEFVFSSRMPDAGFRRVVVERGDTLDGLCKSWKSEDDVLVAPGLVCRINGIADPRRLRAGDALKVPTTSPRIEVDKATHRLVFYLGDIAVKEYLVGLGKDGSTPEGSFVVKTKQIDPAWTWKGTTYPAGHSSNILGSRWMGFENRDDLFGYGIHGTTQPESVGTDASNGCVRMLKQDVEELFEWVPRGTVVTVR